MNLRLPASHHPSEAAACGNRVVLLHTPEGRKAGLGLPGFLREPLSLRELLLLFGASASPTNKTALLNGWIRGVWLFPLCRPASGDSAVSDFVSEQQLQLSLQSLPPEALLHLSK